MITVLADDATIAGTGTATTASTGSSPGSDRGGPRARGDVVGSVKHEMLIGRCDRSEDIVEPRLKTQWFVRTGPLALRALDATRSGRTRIVPERYSRSGSTGSDIRDWNVSRQL